MWTAKCCWRSVQSNYIAPHVIRQCGSLRLERRYSQTVRSCPQNAARDVPPEDLSMARIATGVVVPRYRPWTGMRVDRLSSRVFVDHCHGIAVEWKMASLTEAPYRHHQPIPSPVTDYQTVS